MRVIPDVSAYADPATGTLVGQTTLQPDGVHFAFSLSRIGGTSLASPTFAGIEADAQQVAGHAIGFANPAIYARAGSSAFNDVTEPSSPTYEVRNDFTDPCTATGPLVTTLRQLGDQRCRRVSTDRDPRLRRRHRRRLAEELHPVVLRRLGATVAATRSP